MPYIGAVSTSVWYMLDPVSFHADNLDFALIHQLAWST